jgi:translocator protein
MKLNKIFKLIFSILICHLAGIIGSFFTAPAIPEWYASLQKPFFAPPNWVFAPVWISLFTLMGIAFYLIWEKGTERDKVKLVLFVFCVHLGLNTLWSVLFFGLRSSFLAFLEIIVLWFFVLWITRNFYKLYKLAGILLFPYLAWLSVAALLNFFIWRINL